MKKEIYNALSTLKKGDIIIYPTDTIWGIGCDATNANAVKKIFELKKRKEAKSLIVLVDSEEMLQVYIKKIPAKVSCVLAGTSRPTSVIYKNPKGLAPNIIAADNSVAIRIVKDEFCQKLIRDLGKPIVSTSANLSGSLSPKSYNDIDKTLLKKVDYVVDLHRDKIQSTASQLVKFGSTGKIEFLRK